MWEEVEDIITLDRMRSVIHSEGWLENVAADTYVERFLSRQFSIWRTPTGLHPDAATLVLSEPSVKASIRSGIWPVPMVCEKSSKG